MLRAFGAPQFLPKILALCAYKNMNKLLLIIALVIFSNVTLSEEITVTWNKLIKECELALIDGEMEKARQLAFELNSIDPADTHVMYYLVLTHTELNLPVPKWLIEHPWPNATKKDRENYRRASRILNGT